MVSFNYVRSVRDEIDSLRFFFLDKQAASLSALGENFSQAIKISDRWYDHALIFYHATMNAEREVYGSRTREAAEIIRDSLRDWADKAISLRGLPSQSWIIPQTLRAFAILGVRPPASYLDMCEQATLRDLKRYNAKDLRYWIQASAILAINPGENIRRVVCDRLETHALKMDSRNLHHLARDMAIFDAVMMAREGRSCAYLKEAFNGIFSHPAVRREVEGAVGRENTRKIFEAALWFSGEKEGRCRDFKEDPERSSLLEMRVSEEFRKAGARVLPPQRVPGSANHIDLSLCFNDRSFHVEVDGPGHFVRSTNGQIVTLDGPTVFQTLLNGRKFPDDRLIRLPYTLWDKHQGDSKVWVNICHQAVAAEPGTYLADTDGKLTPDLLTWCRVPK